MKNVFFVTGTDTEVGKTTISCGLLAKAKQQGLSTAAVKPVASGCEQMVEGLRNDDALALWRETTTLLSYDELNPVAFKAAIAPHIAAQEENVELNAARLIQGANQVLAKQADFTVIEGAGGWRVPLSDTEHLSDVVKAIDVPVILVVGVRLGCINHAILTLEAIRHDGLKPVAWVANVVDDRMSRLAENLTTLQTQLQLPCLGTVPYLAHPSASAVANYLTLTALLEV